MPDESPSPETIVLKALEKRSPEERADYLDAVCGRDTDLRHRVERLLNAESQIGNFLEKSPLENLIDDPTKEMSGLRRRSEPADDLTSMSFDTGYDVSLDFLAPCDTPDRIGSLGFYEIIQVVGHGGLGVVLKAFDPKLSRVVAIKVPLPEYASNAAVRKRFFREAQAAAAVSHDHVVTIHAVDEADGRPYLVMEFVEGQSLQQRIDRDGPLELKEILRIGLQTAAGLAAAHAQGLIHRDIKPSNILLENGVERVKITDFGLARAVDDVGITRTGEVPGTPQFMSPEQASGEQVDHRSDLFSLGSVMYAMCTGRPPFRAESAYAVLRRVCEDTPRDLRQINPDIPDWMLRIIDKLLAKKQQDRFQSAREVAELLSAHLAHLQYPMVAPPPLESASSPTESPFSGKRASKPSRRKLLWLLTAIPILVLAGIVMIINREGGCETQNKLPQGSGATKRNETTHLAEDRVQPPAGPVVWYPTLAQQAFFDKVADLPPDQQVEEVRRKLVAVNPGFDGSLKHKVVDGRVDELQIITDNVARIWPVRALVDLRTLYCQGNPVRKDGSEFKGKLADLLPLQGMKLTRFNCCHTAVSDLSPLSGMPLTSLSCEQTLVTTLSPLQGMPLEQIRLDVRLFHEPDLAILRSLPLKTINGDWIVSADQRQIERQSADDFWKRLSGRRRAAETFAAEVAGLPCRKRIAAVRARLLELNGDGGIGALKPDIEEGVVIAVTLPLKKRTSDVTPLRAFGKLKQLTLVEGPHWLDISAVNSLPLQELACTEEIAIRNSPVLRGMATLKRINGQPVHEYLDSLVSAAKADESQIAWTPIFNRQDLTGWKSHPERPGGWQVRDGMLVGRGPSSYLFSERGDFRDFDLRLEARINGGGNGGILIRCAFNLERDPLGSHPVPFGYEANIADRSGKFHVIGPSRTRESAGHPVDTDDWFTLDVISRGNAFKIMVNGKTAAEYVDPDRTFQQGHLVLQAFRSDTVLEVRKIEIREFSAPRIIGRIDITTPSDRRQSPGTAPSEVARNAGDGFAEPMAFALLGADDEESPPRFASLDEAVASARSGDIIEVHGNGPFLTRGVNVGSRSLTIRSADGFHPVIRLTPTDPGNSRNLLVARGRLVLEGLELQRIDPQDSDNDWPRTLLCRGGPLYLAHCRIVQTTRKACLGLSSLHAELRNCEILMGGSSLLNYGFPAGGQLVVENCLLAGGSIVLRRGDIDARGAVVRFTDNTFVGKTTLFVYQEMLPQLPEPDAETEVLRIDASGNVLAAPESLLRFEQSVMVSELAPLPPDEAESFAFKILKWHGARNIVDAGARLFDHSLNWIPVPSSKEEIEPGTQQFPHFLELGHLRGRVRFQGGVIRARPAARMMKLTPDDFRLRPESAGYRSAGDHPDLGANVDQVGPGEPYSRWKLTDGYQQWLKNSGQINSPGAQRPQAEQTSNDLQETRINDESMPP